MRIIQRCANRTVQCISEQSVNTVCFYGLYVYSLTTADGWPPTSEKHTIAMYSTTGTSKANIICTVRVLQLTG